MRRILYSLLLISLIVLALSAAWRYRNDHAFSSYPTIAVSSDGAYLRVVLREIANTSAYTNYGDCGPLAVAAIDRLHREGYAARLVVVLTLESWNGFNDGHTMVEVFDPAAMQWIVFDPSSDRLYPQTVVSFVQQRAEYETLSTDRIVAASFHDSANIFSDFEAFYNRVGQVALIRAENGLLVFGDEAVRQRAESYASDYRYDPNFMVDYYW